MTADMKPKKLFKTCHTGSISIFLCLICSLLLSITFVTIDSCRLSVMKAHVEGISYLSLESVLGNFSVPLLEQYDLLAVPMNNLEIHTFLDQEIKKNTQPSENLKGIYYDLLKINNFEVKNLKPFRLTDENGLYFIRQIQNIILQNPVNLTQNIYALSSYLPFFSKQSADLKNLDTSTEFVDASYDLDEFEGSTSETSPQNPSLSQESAAQKKQSILERMKDLLVNSNLTLYIDNPASISSAQVELSNLPSKICTFRKKSSLSVTEKLLYHYYLSEYFSCYTDNDSSKALKYQLEYILNGSNKDEENLSQSIQKIQTLRTGLNLAYLYTDTEKRNLVYQISCAAVGMFAIPFLVEFTQFVLLSAWANAEAIVDVQNLLKGNKIPFLKSKSTWSLSFDELTTFDKNQPVNSSKNGFSYKEYLCLLLFYQFSNTTIFRTMDAIQMDICKQDNPDFLMAECAIAIQSGYSYFFSPLFTFHQIPLSKNTIFSHTFTMQKSY